MPFGVLGVKYTHEHTHTIDASVVKLIQLRMSKVMKIVQKDISARPIYCEAWCKSNFRLPWSKILPTYPSILVVG